jgi:hypothetical protein
VLVDYSKSIILIHDEYIDIIKEKERCKEAILKEGEALKLEVDLKKVERHALKLLKIVHR